MLSICRCWLSGPQRQAVSVLWTETAIGLRASCLARRASPGFDQHVRHPKTLPQAHPNLQASVPRDFVQAHRPLLTSSVVALEATPFNELSVARNIEGAPPLAVVEPALSLARFSLQSEERVIVFTFRLMTYNIQGQMAERKPQHLEQVAGEITNATPDVACLQEVHCRTRRIAVDQAWELSALTGMTVAFGRSCGLDGGDYGNALLTRGEIANSEVYPLPGSGEPRALMRNQVRLDGHLLEILVTHLTPWGPLRRMERLRQVGRIAELLAPSPRLPRVLTGDLNVTSRARELKDLLFRTGLRTSDDGSEPTHPLTRMRLDHILYGPGVSVLRSRVIRSGPSDHWPLVAELAVEAP